MDLGQLAGELLVLEGVALLVEDLGHGGDHPSAISFFRVHTILHDILGFDTIITRYTRYFKSVKNCVFF